MLNHSLCTLLGFTLQISRHLSTLPPQGLHGYLSSRLASPNLEYHFPWQLKATPYKGGRISIMCGHLGGISHLCNDESTNESKKFWRT